MSIAKTFHGRVEDTLDALIILEACRQGVLPKINRRLLAAERGLMQGSLTATPSQLSPRSASSTSATAPSTGMVSLPTSIQLLNPNPSLIVPGSVFVFDEKASGIHRWTDGRIWSPSRICGNFLVYRELHRKLTNEACLTPQEKAKMRDGTGLKDMALRERVEKEGLIVLGCKKGTFVLKKDGLTKKTICVKGLDLPSPQDLKRRHSQSNREGSIKRKSRAMPAGFSDAGIQHLVYYEKEGEMDGLHRPIEYAELLNLPLSKTFITMQNYRSAIAVLPLSSEDQRIDPLDEYVHSNRVVEVQISSQEARSSPTPMPRMPPRARLRGATRKKSGQHKNEEGFGDGGPAEMGDESRSTTSRLQYISTTRNLMAFRPPIAILNHPYQTRSQERQMLQLQRIRKRRQGRQGRQERDDGTQGESFLSSSQKDDLAGVKRKDPAHPASSKKHSKITSRVQRITETSSMCSSSSDEKVDPIQGLKQRLILGNTKTELDKDRRRCDLTSEGESTDHPAVLAQSGMADERAIGISSQSKSPYLRTSYHLSSSPGHISMDTSRSSLSYQNSLAPLLSLSPVTPEGHIKTTPAVEDLPSTYQHTMELMRPAALNTPKDFETQQNEPTPSFLAMTESTTHSFSGGNARFSGDYQKAQECVPWPAFGPILGEHSCGADAPLEGEQGLGGSSSLDSECTHHSSSVPSSASGHPSQRSSGFVAYHQRGTTSGAVNKLRAAQADGTVVDTPQGMFLGYPLAHRSYACITSSSTESHRILTQERGVSRPPVSKEIFTEQHVSMHEHSNAFSRQWLQISPTFRSTPSSTSCIQGPQATTPGRGTSLGGPYPLNVQTLIDDHHHVERPWISGGDTRSLTRGMRKESGMSANRQESTSSAARTSVPDPNAALSQVCLHDSLMPFSSPACPSPFRDSSAVEMRLSRAQHICMPSSSCMFADTFQRSDIQESTHYRSMRGAPRQPIVQRSCEKESASSNPSGPNEQIGSSYLDVNSLYSGVPHSASSNNFQSPPLYFVGSGGSNYDVTSQQQYKSTAPSAMCRDLFGNECQYEETGSRYEGASDHPHFACEPTGTMDERMSTAEALPTMHPGADIPYEQYVEGQEIDFLRSGNSPGADEYLLHVNRLRDSQPSLTLRLNSGPTSENLSSVMSCQEDTGHDMLIFLSGMHLRQFSDGREQNKLGDQGE